MNLVILTGRLTRDPEMRFTPSGASLTTFSVATDRSGKPREGQPTADFHNIVVWGSSEGKPGAAEACANYLKKGSMVSVRGAIQTRSWGKDGDKRYSTEIVADRYNGIEFLKDYRSKAEVEASSGSAVSNDAPDPDDMPF